MNRFICIIFIGSVLTFEAELSVAFKSEAIKNLEFAFEKKIYDKIKLIKMADFEAVNNSFFRFKFHETFVSISNYSKDTFKLNFFEDNKINISVNNLHAVMFTMVYAKVLFNTSGKFIIDLNNINITAELIFLYSPFSFRFENFRISFKQQIKTEDSKFLRFLKANFEMWDSVLHDYIETQLSKKVKDKLDEMLFKNLHGDKINNENGVSLKIIGEPIVKQGFLILPLNIDFFLFDKVLPKSGAEKFDQFYDLAGESVQVRINFDQLQHAAALLHHFELIKFNISYWTVAKSGLLLTTTQLGIFFKDILKKHDKDLPIGLEFSSIIAPKMVINEETATVDIALRMDIFVFESIESGLEGPKKYFSSYFTNMKASVMVKIEKHFKLEIEIDEIIFENTVDADTHACSEDGSDFENFLNFVTGTIRPIINKSIKNLKIEKINFYGISFEELKGNLMRNDLEIQMTPVLQEGTVDWEHPILIQTSGIKN